LRTFFIVFALAGSLALAVACGGNSPEGTPTATLIPVDSNGSGDPTVTPEPTPTSAATEIVLPKQYSSPPSMTIDAEKIYTATLETSEGTMVLELLPKVAPVTVNNFVFLAREGYYDGVPFHRILEGFMVQTGDPTGTGRGGPGYLFEDEPVTLDYVRGAVAMANADADTNGSQFFIMHSDRSLPKQWTIFGQVLDGFDTLDRIASAAVTANPKGEVSAPLTEIRITSVAITES
jgi:cyclophilin family peptidyl-prolyl cis-trans isomerase